jgi:manganese/zinc/iron transport system ATP- binding protein
MSGITLVSDQGVRLNTAADDRNAPLTIRGLTVSYGQVPAVYSIDFTAPTGSLMGIVGPNGAGKSTLLQAAMEIVPIISGQVSFFGKPLREARHQVAYVPQRASVDWDFPATVYDVVLMGLYPSLGLLRRVSKGDKAKVAESLEKVGMQDFMSRQIGQLSGGQQQRVFLARSLVQRADVFLLDEPFSGVDAATETAIMALLKALKLEGKTVIAVHHDLSTVSAYFDHLFLLNRKAVAYGPVTEVFTKNNLVTAYGGKLGAAQMDAIGL